MHKFFPIIGILLLLSGCTFKVTSAFRAENSSSAVISARIESDDIPDSAPETSSVPPPASIPSLPAEAQSESASKIPSGEKTVTKEAGLFVSLFSDDYKGAGITKIRWQLVDNEKQSITYIIEGIKNNKQYSVKYYNKDPANTSPENIIILGRDERPLTEEELKINKTTEPFLDLENCVSVQQIKEISLGEFDSKIQEWKLVRIEGRQIVQVLLWDETFLQKILTFDSVTGEILRKLS